MSEQQRLERENRRLAWELRRATAQLPRLRMMVEFAGDLIVLISERGSLLECNESCALMRGEERGSLYGKPMSLLFHDQSEGSAILRRLETLRGEQETRCQVELATAEGTAVMAEVLGRVVIWEERKHYVLVMRDISKQEQLRRELHLLQYTMP